MKFQPAFSIGCQALNADNSILCILGINENIPPPKFRYFEKYKISFKLENVFRAIPVKHRYPGKTAL